MNTNQHCNTCTFFYKPDTTCRYDPPKVVMIPTPGALAGHLKLGKAGLYPPVAPNDIGCSRHGLCPEEQRQI